MNGKVFLNFRCDCQKSHLECQDFTMTELKSYFTYYYDKLTPTARIVFLHNCIEVVETKANLDRIAKGQEPKDRSSRIYYLDGRHVCQQLFIKTFNISLSKINYLLTNKQTADGRPIAIDYRGLNTNLKLDREHVNFIEQIGMGLPQYKSHFTSKSVKYWHSMLTWTIVFQLYLEKVSSDHPDWMPVSSKTVQHYIKLRFPKVK